MPDSWLALPPPLRADLRESLKRTLPTTKPQVKPNRTRCSPSRPNSGACRTIWQNRSRRRRRGPNVLRQSLRNWRRRSLRIFPPQLSKRKCGHAKSADLVGRALGRQILFSFARQKNISASLSCLWPDGEISSDRPYTASCT